MNDARETAYFVIKLRGEYDVAGRGTSVKLRDAKQYPTRSSAVLALGCYVDDWRENARIVRVTRRAKPKTPAEVFVIIDEGGIVDAFLRRDSAEDERGSGDVVVRYILAVPQ